MKEKSQAFKFGHTLAEVIMAMVVISMIAGFTMKITKHKMEGLVGYYYYSAYSTLKAAAGEIIAEKSSIPNDGTLCTLVESYLNVSIDSCNSATSTITGTPNNNFGSYTPDLITRTGARIYNLKSNSIDLSARLGNDKNGQPIMGRTVYIDIDGEKGASTLWQDVFSFLLTDTGLVIPEYRASPAAGGNSNKYLEASVRYDTFPTDGTRKTNWLHKSVDFKTAACSSGYVATSTYCSTLPAVTKDNTICTAEADCTVVIIKPMRWF
jgi:hypothetical protein